MQNKNRQSHVVYFSLYNKANRNSNKQSTKEGSTLYLVKFNSFHVIAAELAISALHLFTGFSTELKCDEK